MRPNVLQRYERMMRESMAYLPSAGDDELVDFWKIAMLLCRLVSEEEARRSPFPL